MKSSLACEADSDRRRNSLFSFPRSVFQAALAKRVVKLELRARRLADRSPSAAASGRDCIPSLRRGLDSRLVQCLHGQERPERIELPSWSIMPNDERVCGTSRGLVGAFSHLRDCPPVHELRPTTSPTLVMLQPKRESPDLLGVSQSRRPVAGNPSPEFPNIEAYKSLVAIRVRHLPVLSASVATAQVVGLEL